MPQSKQRAAVRRTTASRTKKPASPARKAPARGKKTAAVKKRVPVKQQAARMTAREDTAALIYILLGVFLCIFLWAGTNDEVNGFIKGINKFIRGMFGSLGLAAAITSVWIGVRKVRGPEKQGIRGTGVFVPCAMLMCLLTAVEIFLVENIKKKMMVASSYFNFLGYAYKEQRGGGLLGAMIADVLGVFPKWMALPMVIAVALIILELTGFMNLRSVAGWVGARGRSAAKAVTKAAGDARQKAAQRREEREQLYNEKLFEDDSNKKPKLTVLKDDDGHRVNVTTLKEPGNEFVVPKVGSRKKQDTYSVKREPPAPKQEAPVYTEKPEAFKRKVSAPDFEETLSRPAPKEPPVKNALREEPAEKPAPKQPQQPKPSFSDDGVKHAPIIRQNTEQGQKAAPIYNTYSRTPTPAAKPEVKPEVKPVSRSAAAPVDEQPTRYNYPSMDLMETGGTQAGAVNGITPEDAEKAEILINTLHNFNVNVKLVGVSHGPAVTRFEILPDSGTKISRISTLADDIAMELAATSVRIEAPIPGKRAVGVEIPNTKKEIVHLRDVLDSAEARKCNKQLMVALGKDNSGKYIVADLESMPHVLIAGQTGSGKSVCINSIIISLLYRTTPEEVRMIMVDPKMVELNVYNTIPHLLVPVVTDPQKAAGALDWAVVEMSRRYKIFKEHGSKNISSYNAHLQPGEDPMPRIVIIIDELADLMMTAKHEVEESINRLAQLARAAGMHLVIATQRPSVNVITGLIKANIPTRIAFTVASGVDSSTILDSYGAEKLLGRGDMLFLPPDRNKPMRMQGAWVSEDEVQAVVEAVSSEDAVVFDEDMIKHLEQSAESDAEKKDKKEEEANDGTDELFEEALRSVVDAGQASISMLQRKLRVGYARAGRLIDLMAKRGYISSAEGAKARDVLITREELNRLYSDEKDDFE